MGRQLSLADPFLGTFREGLPSQATIQVPSQPAPCPPSDHRVHDQTYRSFSTTGHLMQMALSPDGSESSAHRLTVSSCCFVFVFSKVGLELVEGRRNNLLMMS